MPGKKATTAQKKKAYANMTKGGMSPQKAQEILKMYMGGMTMPAAIKKAMGGPTVPKKRYGSATKPKAVKPKVMRKGGKTSYGRKKKK